MASIPARRVAEPAAKASRLWWRVHQWVGFKLSIFMAFVCLTGSIAVFSSEIDWLIYPSLRVSPASVQGPVRWDRIATEAARYEPGVGRIQYIGAPIASAFAARVSFERPDKTLGYLHAHPTTGRIQGEQGFVDTHRIFRNLHRHLNLPTKYGVPLVSLLSILLTISVATSFVVYKKWWRGFWKPIRTRDARTGWGDFHRLAGVWSLWFVALIAVTGLWYLAESLGGAAPPMPKAEVEPVTMPLPDLAARLGPALAAARAAAPDLVIEQVGFPAKKSGAFLIQGQRQAILVRPRANTVFVAAGNGRALLATDARDLGIHTRISEMADPLHFGTWGGYWTKIPWFLFGLAMTALSVSGVAIYGLRIGRELHLANTTRTVWNRAWSGMGVWRWPALACVAIGLAMLPTLFMTASE